MLGPGICWICRYRPALIRVGNATNKVYVHLKYASGQLLNKAPDSPKVTLNVKPLEDDVALGVGVRWYMYCSVISTTWGLCEP